MVNKRERGSREARLATVRLGLFTFAAIFVVSLLALMVRLYIGFRDANDAEGVNYTIGNFLGDVVGDIAPLIIIIVFVALVLNFGYTFWLNSRADGGGGSAAT